MRRLRQSQLLDPLDGDFYALLAGLPLTAAIVAANPVDLVAGPETDEYSLIAAAEERVEAATARLSRLEEQLEKEQEHVTELRFELERTRSEEVETALDKAEAHLAMVARRVLKARAAGDSAQRELAKVLGGEIPNS